MKTEYEFFKPRALQKAPIVRETYFTDNTAPHRDWSRFDEPAFKRRTSRVIRIERRQV